MQALAHSDLAGGLTSLCISRAEPETTFTLAQSRRLTRLNRLRLLGIWGEAEDAQALLESPHLPSLAHLEMSEARLGGHFRMLARLPGLARLRTLALKDCDLTVRDVRELARSPHLSGLVRLDLSSNTLTDEGLRALLDAPWLAGLRELRLGYTYLTEAALAYLAACPALARLRVLALGINWLTRQGAETLANSPHFSRLLCLKLRPRGREIRDLLRERFGPAFQPEA